MVTTRIPLLNHYGAATFVPMATLAIHANRTFHVNGYFILNLSDIQCDPTEYNQTFHPLYTYICPVGSKTDFVIIYLTTTKKEVSVQVCATLHVGATTEEVLKSCATRVRRYFY